MFKITCLVAKQENIFYLSNVSQDDVEQVATVLANNLSFDEQNTNPTVSSIVQVDMAETPLFEYIGTEIIKNNEFEYRQSLYEKEILTGAIFNFKDKTTTIYKFKVLEK